MKWSNKKTNKRKKSTYPDRRTERAEEPMKKEKKKALETNKRNVIINKKNQHTLTAELKEQKNLKERKEESIRNKIKRNRATKKQTNEKNQHTLTTEPKEPKNLKERKEKSIRNKIK